MIELTTQEAVRILRKYTEELYNTRNRRAHQMAIDALEKQEHRPLTIAELRKMGGQKVYCLDLNTEAKVSAPEVGFIKVHYSIPGEWGSLRADKLTLYRQKPEEK